ncbi:uncharacterized protein [Oscarella lobularis]|uniref:uncharacterized protein isoform X1 n=1 Tax=Oscarella lobularis TaxID=121494 RepID=UPI003313DD4D
MTLDDITESGKSLKHLPKVQLSKIKPKSLTDGLDSASQVDWSSDQAKALIPVLEHGFNKSVSKWGGHRRAGNITRGLQPKDIADMPSRTFDEFLETLAGNCEQMDDGKKQAIRNATKSKLGGGFDGVSEEDIGRMGCAGMHRDVMSSKNFGSSEDGINMAAQSMKKALMTGKVDRNTVRRDRRETVCESFLRTKWPVPSSRITVSCPLLHSKQAFVCLYSRLLADESSRQRQKRVIGLKSFATTCSRRRADRGVPGRVRHVRSYGRR